MKFIFNDSNVCINPEIIYHDKHDASYHEIGITVACDENGKWDWGHDTSGGRSFGSGGLPQKNGKYETKEDAVSAAIKFVADNCKLSVSKPIDCNNNKIAKEMSKKFLEWVAQESAPDLFKSNEDMTMDKYILIWKDASGKRKTKQYFDSIEEVKSFVLSLEADCITYSIKKVCEEIIVKDQPSEWSKPVDIPVVHEDHTDEEDLTDEEINAMNELTDGPGSSDSEIVQIEACSNADLSNTYSEDEGIADEILLGNRDIPIFNRVVYNIIASKLGERDNDDRALYYESPGNIERICEYLRIKQLPTAMLVFYMGTQFKKEDIEYVFVNSKDEPETFSIINDVWSENKTERLEYIFKAGKSIEDLAKIFEVTEDQLINKLIEMALVDTYTLYYKVGQNASLVKYRETFMSVEDAIDFADSSKFKFYKVLRNDEVEIINKLGSVWKSGQKESESKPYDDKGISGIINSTGSLSSEEIFELNKLKEMKKEILVMEGILLSSEFYSKDTVVSKITFIGFFPSGNKTSVNGIIELAKAYGLNANKQLKIYRDKDKDIVEELREIFYINQLDGKFMSAGTEPVNNSIFTKEEGIDPDKELDDPNPEFTEALIEGTAKKEKHLFDFSDIDNMLK